MPRLDDLLEVAREAEAAASRVVRDGAGRPVEAETKSHGDYVTAVDRAAEQAAGSVLRSRTPDIPIVGEEGGGELDAGRGWLVDPLDGTTNFVRGFVVVGVSVALVEDGQPVVGVVAAPLLGRSWWASRGGGAVASDGRRLHVRSHAGLGVVATGFPFRRKSEQLPRYMPVMEAALEQFEDLRRAGAASLDLANTAAGVWDGFFELGLGPWDIAAGALLLTEAGGVVTDWDGDPQGALSSGDILAATPAAHERLLGIARAARAGRHP